LRSFLPNQVTDKLTNCFRDITLRGLSDQTYEGLRQLATRNHRSMQEQVGGVERARRWRSLLAGRHFPDLAADIQADRSR